jgi:Phage integrase family.
VYTLLDRVSEIAGIGFHVRPHMLRATFITLSLEAGVPVVDVMNSAGHSSLSMVSYYDRGYRDIRRAASRPLAAWLGA